MAQIKTGSPACFALGLVAFIVLASFASSRESISIDRHIFHHFSWAAAVGAKDEACSIQLKSHASLNPMNFGNRGASFAPLGWCLNFTMRPIAASRLAQMLAAVS